jgi:glycopeptide antibiotics resistance protein
MLAHLAYPLIVGSTVLLFIGITIFGVLRTTRKNRSFDARIAIALLAWLGITAYLTQRPGHGSRLNLDLLAYPATLEPLENVLYFVPLGILLATLGWRLIAVAGAGMAVSVTIEVTQYFVNDGRTADINDVITNTLGAVVGWLVVFAVRRFVARRADRRTVS